MIYSSQEELLKQPLKRLKLGLKGSTIGPYIAQLRSELKDKGIPFSPHIWISDDWFSPDGHAGFAIPFYLLRPDLLRMERKFTGEVEGANKTELMKLLRHETAHALDNAFNLRKNRTRQKLFGLASTPYPATYKPNKRSKDFVINLSDNYAQSHPEEDFAETFAVWLNPKSNWRTKYRNSKKAMEKLLFIEKLMTSLKEKKKKKIKKSSHDELKSLNGTLESYYLKKRKKLGIVEILDVKKDLHKIFSNKVESNKNINAAKLIKAKKIKICSSLINNNRIQKGQLSMRKKKINKLLLEVHRYCKDQKLTTSNSKKSISTLSSVLIKRSKVFAVDKNRIIM